MPCGVPLCLDGKWGREPMSDIYSLYPPVQPDVPLIVGHWSGISRIRRNDRESRYGPRLTIAETL